MAETRNSNCVIRNPPSLSISQLCLLPCGHQHGRDGPISFNFKWPLVPVISEEKRCFIPSIDSVWITCSLLDQALCWSWLTPAMWQKVPPGGGEGIPERKWKQGIGGQFYHLKKDRNSGQAETRDICTECLSFSIHLPLGNNQGCERVTRLFTTELFTIMQNQKKLKCWTIKVS